MESKKTVIFSHPARPGNTLITFNFGLQIESNSLSSVHLCLPCPVTDKKPADASTILPGNHLARPEGSLGTCAIFQVTVNHSAVS